MTDEELIARLRKADEYEPLGHDGWEAADRIEALVKERDALKRLKNAQSQMLDAEEARVKRLEAALRLLHDNVVLAFPTLADLGPVANARAALKGTDHE